MKSYKWQLFFKGFMIIYLKTALFSMVNIVKFNTDNFICSLSSVLATVWMAILIFYPIVWTFFSLLFKSMTLPERSSSYFFNKVVFDEYGEF